uniref:Uncharacterized protein n=1 Tax=Anguilla anguilla TaxID=7936 RepID=A0A0E9WXS9_ANGAN
MANIMERSFAWLYTHITHSESLVYLKYITFRIVILRSKFQSFPQCFSMMHFLSLVTKNTALKSTMVWHSSTSFMDVSSSQFTPGEMLWFWLLNPWGFQTRGRNLSQTRKGLQHHFNPLGHDNVFLHTRTHAHTHARTHRLTCKALLPAPHEDSVWPPSSTYCCLHILRRAGALQ